MNQQEYSHSEWSGTTDGTPWMQRALVAMFRFLPLSLAYGLMGLVIPFYMAFDRSGYRHSYRYFRKRIGRGMIASFFSVYANEFRLGQVVLDRFAMYAGRSFRFDIENHDAFLSLAAGEGGFVQLSSHIGNYELAGYSLRCETKAIYALVFAGEKAAVSKGRSEMFARTNIHMVPVAADYSHIFALNEALSAGQVASLPGDRLFGSKKSFTCDFLGAPAKFPAGPFALAASRDVPVLTFFVMKTSLRGYRILLKPLESSRNLSVPSGKRAAEMAREFAGILENVVRQYPTQWYNFFDFWAE